MANLKKPANKRDLLPTQLQPFLANAFAAHKLTKPHVLLAFSGGLDSTVLLHMLCALRASMPFTLSAAHVHHGLSANADAWADFCAHTCRTLNVPFMLKKIQVDKNSGLGLEAAARQARYDALNEAQADFICLAHHQNDQAETLLLQLARGAGAKGLAGMAQVDVCRKLLRPLLQVSRTELEAYAKQHDLRWVEDESNQNTQFDRNFMRLEVLPSLQKRYPAVVQSLSRSAENLAEAQALLDDLAQIDAGTHAREPLPLELLKPLNQARQANVMRWWLAQQHIAMPSAQQLKQILAQMLAARPDAAIKIKVAEQQYLRRFQGAIYLVADCEKLAPINLLWQGEHEIRLPNQSRLQFKQVLGQGLVVAPQYKLRIKNREGGERFRPQLGRPSRSLKQVLQTSAVPPWQREQLPLVFMDDTLVYIPNIGAAAELQAKPHEGGYVITFKASEYEP